MKEGAVAGYSKLIGAGSIYAITPCTKEAALAAVEEAQHRPLVNVTLPPDAAVPQLVGATDDDEDDGCFDGCFDDHDDESEAQR